MKQNTENQTSGPWYKYPMVWLVFILPFIAVVASLTTVYIAAKNAPVVLEHNESYKAKLNQKPDTEDGKND